MAGEELRVGIRLTADGRDFVGAVREAARELDKLSRAAKSASGVARSTAAANSRVADTLRVARDAVIAYATNQALAALQTAKFSGSASTAVRQTRVLVVAMRGGSVAAVAYTRTVRVATVATRGFGRALKTNLGPIGLAFIGLELLLGKLLPAAEGYDDLTGALDDSAGSVEDLTEQFRYLSEAQVNASRGDLVAEIEEQTEQLRQAAKNVEKLTEGELVPQRTLLGEGVVRVVDHAAVDEARATASGIAAEITALEARLVEFDHAAAAAKVQRDRDEAEQRASELAAAAKQRQVDINREAARVVASLRSELAVLTDTYNAERSAIEQSTKLTADQREAALALLETRHEQALADLERAEAEKAAAAEAATGVSALADLREETAALTAGEYESIEALESMRRQRELELSVKEQYASATDETVAGIVEETLRLGELEQKLKDETAARDRANERREKALESLTGGPNPYAEQIESLKLLLASAPETFGTGSPAAWWPAPPSRRSSISRNAARKTRSWKSCAGSRKRSYWPTGASRTGSSRRRTSISSASSTSSTVTSPRRAKSPSGARSSRRRAPRRARRSRWERWRTASVSSVNTAARRFGCPRRRLSRRPS